MSYPRKSRGWRTISIDRQVFLWHFDPGHGHAYLKLQGGEKGGRQAIIYMRDWHDVWLHMPDKMPPNAPYIVTPQFVELAIRFALTHGWTPDQNGEMLRFGYRNQTFAFERYGTRRAGLRRAIAPMPNLSPRTSKRAPRRDLICPLKIKDSFRNVILYRFGVRNVVALHVE